MERLIGTVRHEFLDHILFWNARDLELAGFQRYYNEYRAHSSLGGDTPAEFGGVAPKPKITLNNFRWKSFGGGLFQLPVAA